jgi:polyhydroxyalkanoate synthase
MFQLLQYQPVTDDQHRTPLLIIPPEISRHYVVDLAPGRSLVEWTLSQELATFAIVWRNPQPGNGAWGMDEYVQAQMRAIEIVCQITGSPEVNVMGVCGGGLSVAAMLGYQAAQEDRRVRSATFVVTMVDSGQPSLLGAITNDRGQTKLDTRAERGEILYGWQLLRSFAWLRPNDLIFNYAINNWMLGYAPPAFDVLAWNADCTNATYAFVADASEALHGRNRLARPSEYEVLGVPVDLRRVTCDTFHVAGATDHITPWRACYMTSQAVRGHSEVVVTSTGHVQTIVCPPGKARARFHAGTATTEDPDVWLKEAESREGSWWPHWTEWLKVRSGDKVAAAAEVGGVTHVPTEPAPGRYATG